ncbi:hypothetical protein AMST5_02456 [freshwater sediment metagenome]|jgi:hypothetical protein|uniref:Uncharacterized protein n=1 Tax=freshwater sediment metagenome TaxID=556182 RepID=A0AA48M023_9ZZZZ
MGNSLKFALAAALCGATVLAAAPAEVLAGPMTAAGLTSIELAPSVEKVWYRGGYRGGYGGYYRRGYGYPGAAAGAALGLGLLGAGIAAGASGYSNPGYGYGSGSCWVWDPGVGWVWGC